MMASWRGVRVCVRVLASGGGNVSECVCLCLYWCDFVFVFQCADGHKCQTG